MKNQKNTINDPAAHALIAERVCRWEWNKTFMAWRSGNLFITDDPVKPFKTAANREAAIDAAKQKGWYISTNCNEGGYFSDVLKKATIAGIQTYERVFEGGGILYPTIAEAQFSALIWVAQQLETHD